MREKCQRKGLPQTSQSALKEIRDAIGVRIITGFTDDIYRIVDYIRQLPTIHIFKEKDYIRQVKPNGYRSYHLILEVTTPTQTVWEMTKEPTLSRSNCARLPWTLGPALSTR